LINWISPEEPSRAVDEIPPLFQLGELQVSHYFFCFASSPAGLQYPHTRKRAEMDCFACIHSALTSFTSHEKQKWLTIKVTSLPEQLKSSTMKELITRFFANMRAARGGAENTVENYGLETSRDSRNVLATPQKEPQDRSNNLITAPRQNKTRAIVCNCEQTAKLPRRTIALT
jgi:hypothetical protein